MANVHNWQIGRDMEYPYARPNGRGNIAAESSPNSYQTGVVDSGIGKFPERQFAAVFNTNRCIACQTCTMACKSTWTFSKGQEYMWWNNVETRPYGGYPQFWDIKLLKLMDKAHTRRGKEMSWKKADGDAAYGRYDGMTIFEAAQYEYTADGQSRALGYLPEDHEWSKPNIHEDAAFQTPADGAVDDMGFLTKPVRLPEHKTYFFYMQRLCNHCTYPACVAACPRQAIYKRPEDGVVLIDQERCRGYRKCMEACPYKKPMYNGQTKVSEKCIACYPRLEGKDDQLTPDGVPIETRCMSACVGKIRLQGLVAMNADGTWKEDTANPLYVLVQQEKIALPIYPQFGTAPNIYYIPPRWVPRPYLRQMFGPGVDTAIDRYVCPSRETLAILQLFRVQREIIYSFKVEKGQKLYEKEVAMSDGKKKTLEVFDDTAIGYNKLGKECVRITVKEPFVERSDKHYNSI